MTILNYFGQTYELVNGVCTRDGEVQTSTIPCTDAGVTGVSIPNSVFAILILLVIVFLGLWGLAVYHAFQHQELSSRTKWLAILLTSLPLLLFWLSPFIYYFVVVRNQGLETYPSTADYQTPGTYAQNPNPYIVPPQNTYPGNMPPQGPPPQQYPNQQPPSNQNPYQAPPAPNQTFYPTQDPNSPENRDNQ